ncbi:hypothetical protein VT03_07030 [Planctomyces sp. SH-PL14]|nr:hypothetical protein VT03_07030 [Planctomyces sp. SH-PL14]
MPRTPLFPFSAAVIAAAPALQGVYLLYDSQGGLTYIGRAAGATVTIRSRLQNHLSGAEGPCTQRASYYAYELTIDAANRERELLAECLANYGRLPPCNSVMPGR